MRPAIYNWRRSRCVRQRQGIAVVEFAICLPVLVLIVLGSIEACNMIFLKQALTEAAYQGALEAIKQDATQSAVESRIQSVLTARNISQTNINVANNQLHQVDPGENFTVQVTAQTTGNRMSPTVISSLSQIESTVTAAKQ